MDTQGLSSKELGFVEEAIKMEVLCCEKLEAFRHEIQDPELRDLCTQGLQSCHRNVDDLLQLLR